MKVNKLKLTSVLVILYGSCAYMWYLGSQGNDTMAMLGFVMANGLIYVTAGLVIGIAGAILYKFGQWLTS